MAVVSRLRFIVYTKVYYSFCNNLIIEENMCLLFFR